MTEATILSALNTMEMITSMLRISRVILLTLLMKTAMLLQVIPMTRGVR